MHPNRIPWFPTIAHMEGSFAIVSFLLPVMFYQYRPELAAAVEKHTEEGYFGFRRDKIDITDDAWAGFRDFLPLLIGLMCLQIGGKWGAAKVGLGNVTWTALFGVLVWLVTCGYSIAYVWGWIAVSYCIGWAPLSANVKIAAVWAFNLLALYWMESDEARHLPLVLDSALESLLYPLGITRDGFYGWQNVSYFVSLRSISYVCDMVEIQGRDKERIQGTKSLKAKVLFSRPQEWEMLPPATICGPLSCVAFFLYPPLYLAGPIMPYTNFVADLHRRKPSKHRAKRPDLTFYAASFALLYVVFEVLQHISWPSVVVGYATETSGGSSLRPPGGLGFFHCISWVMLTFTWCKFSLIWRFFRMWAMVDGVYPHEEVTRCMSNNFEIKGFWRSFHATYNKWLVRYIYVPLGGRSSMILGVIVVFAFVVFTHDKRLTHLDQYPYWCGIFVTSYLIEATLAGAVSLLKGSIVGHMLKCAVGSLTIQILFLGNMLTYGFKSGSAGLRFFSGSGGVDVSGIFCYAAYAVVLAWFCNSMQYVRELEKNRGTAAKQVCPLAKLSGGKLVSPVACAFSGLLRIVSVNRGKSVSPKLSTPGSPSKSSKKRSTSAVRRSTRNRKKKTHQSTL